MKNNNPTKFDRKKWFYSRCTIHAKWRLSKDGSTLWCKGMERHSEEGVQCWDDYSRATSFIYQWNSKASSMKLILKCGSSVYKYCSSCFTIGIYKYGLYLQNKHKQKDEMALKWKDVIYPQQSTRWTWTMRYWPRFSSIKLIKFICIWIITASCKNQSLIRYKTKCTRKENGEGKKRLWYTQSIV